MADNLAIATYGLKKSFGDKRAVDDLHLEVPAGTITALLGANGAGKTTLVKILATLLRPDSGSAFINGFDVVSDARRAREVLGLTAQFPAVDEGLTGRDNLLWFGRLRGLTKSQAAARAEDLLGLFDLETSADQKVNAYSGGMRRRLDIASSIVAKPRVLLLDEPTSGIDPSGRSLVWTLVRRLCSTGVGVLCTTQNLDEAESVADHIVVMHEARVLAAGTATELKARVGGYALSVLSSDLNDFRLICSVLELVAVGPLLIRDGGYRISAPVNDGVTSLAHVASKLRECSIMVDDLGVRRPSLDEVLSKLTSGEQTTADPESR